MTIKTEYISMFAFLVTSMILWTIILKGHRRIAILTLLYLVSICSAIWGLTLLNNSNLGPIKGHSTNFLFSPIIYLILYSIVGLIYKKIKGYELPTEYYKSFDSIDKKKIGELERILNLIPFVLGLIIPTYIK